MSYVDGRTLPLSGVQPLKQTLDSWAAQRGHGRIQILEFGGTDPGPQMIGCVSVNAVDLIGK